MGIVGKILPQGRAEPLKLIPPLASKQLKPKPDCPNLADFPPLAPLRGTLEHLDASRHRRDFKCCE